MRVGGALRQYGTAVDREVFADRLAQAAERAWRFAATLVEEPLPPALVFRVRLNRSADRHVPAAPALVRFPEDTSLARDRALRRCDAATVVDELWRDGRVPQWVNAAVVAATDTVTVMGLVCCGRFTDDESLLYHARAGIAPFHVLGPELPAGHDGGRYSIHHRYECWDRADVDHLTTVADKVWSLHVWTDEFDPGALCDLPDLPHLEVVEHHACALGTALLSAFARFPLLRVLRLWLTDPTAILPDAASNCRTLASLEISNLPARPWRIDHFANQAPCLASIALHGPGPLWLDGAFTDRLRALSLTAERIQGEPCLPPALDRLTIRLAHGDDTQVLRLLTNLTELSSLKLRGTPVSDELAVTIPADSTCNTSTWSTPPSPAPAWPSCPPNTQISRSTPAPGDQPTSTALSHHAGTPRKRPGGSAGGPISFMSSTARPESSHSPSAKRATSTARWPGSEAPPRTGPPGVGRLRPRAARR
jgi:hypothetical protein